MYKNILYIVALAALALFSACNRGANDSDFQTSPVEGSRSLIITGYTGNQQEVTIPARIRGLPVTEIGFEAFMEKEINSVTIPPSVTSIGDWAFSGNRLTRVHIPDSVTSIGEGAFAVNHLVEVNIPGNVSSMGSFAFAVNQLDEVTIPAGITEIGQQAFFRNQLTSVSIPDGVAVIGIRAFYQNILTDVTIPDSVTELIGGAFENNPLLSISIGADVYLNDSPFGPDFDWAYWNNDSQAGIYVLEDFNWVFLQHERDESW